MAQTRSTVRTSPGTVSAFHPVLQTWFSEAFGEPTPAQHKAWPSIAAGHSTLLLAPTGSGKTLAAFLVAIDRIMFPRNGQTSRPGGCTPGCCTKGVRTLYISPLKALGVDVERNLRAPVAGVCAIAEREGVDCHMPRIAVRTGDTPQRERLLIARQPPDILITTPESLYLILTSRSRDILATVDTVIVDEIHSMVATKRGAHLFLSLERLERITRRHPGRTAIPRIGLSATQRPLDEVARLLGGSEATGDADTPLQQRHVEVIEAGRSRTSPGPPASPGSDARPSADGARPRSAACQPPH